MVEFVAVGKAQKATHIPTHSTAKRKEEEEVREEKGGGGELW